MSIFDIISDAAKTISRVTEAATSAASKAVSTIPVIGPTASTAIDVMSDLHKEHYNATIEAIKKVSTPAIEAAGGDPSVAHDLLDKAKV